VDSHFSLGKIPNDTLKRTVFQYLGVPNERVICGPAVGEDAAVIKLPDRVLIVKADPITGALENIGWYAVHINANDVAVRGATPLFFLPTILLPENTESKQLEEICIGIDRAAKELGVSIVGGHTETAFNLPRPIVAGAMIGEMNEGEVILSSGAKAGDIVIVTKSAGLEGAAILATERYNQLRSLLPSSTLETAHNFIKRISVVREALLAARTGGVDCLRDPTEGGLLQALVEIAEASRTGFAIEEELVPVAEETRSICEAFQVDPLRLISSGMLVAIAKPSRANEILTELETNGIEASIIGKIVEKGRTLKKRSGEIQNVEDFVQEQLWYALRKELRG